MRALISMEELTHVTAVHLELPCDAADGRALAVEFSNIGEARRAFGLPLIATALLELTDCRKRRRSAKCTVSLRR
ncbi:MAG: hypothetical protein M3458_03380 [Acidobacteriota bacterium]|nr:hypothetical protein [Acidobacteriota bacterium]